MAKRTAAPAAGDLFEARAARDVALQTVEDNAGDWTDAALGVIRRSRGRFRGELFTGEATRHYITATLGYGPHHPNAWGALINIAVKRELLERTDQFGQMKDKRSHARITRLYRVGRAERVTAGACGPPCRTSGGDGMDEMIRNAVRKAITRELERQAQWRELHAKWNSRSHATTPYLATNIEIEPIVDEIERAIRPITRARTLTGIVEGIVR